MSVAKTSTSTSAAVTNIVSVQRTQGGCELKAQQVIPGVDGDGIQAFFNSVNNCLFLVVDVVLRGRGYTVKAIHCTSFS